MTEELETLQAVRDSVDTLSGKIDTLERTTAERNTKLSHRIWVAIAGILVLVIAVLLGAVALGYSVKEAHCNRAYNNASAERTSVVSPANLNLSISMGKVMEAAFRPPAGSTKEQTTAEFNAALATYFDHLDTVLADYGANPLPVAPKYAC